MLVLLRFALSLQPKATAAAIALATFAAAIGVLLTYLTGQVVGAVPAVLDGQADGPAFGFLVAGLGLCFVADTLAPVGVDAVLADLRNRIDADVTLWISRIFLAPLRVTHLEDPAIADLRERARGRTGLVLSGGVTYSVLLLRSRLTVLGSAALVGAMFSWWIAGALVLSTRFAEWLVGRSVDKESGAWEMRTEGHRRAGYLFELGMGGAPKELRIFGLGPWLVRRYVEHWTAAIRPMWRTRRKAVLSMCVTLVVHVAVHAVAVWLAVRDAAAGQLSVAGVATVVPAILAIGLGYAGGEAGWVRRGLDPYRALTELRSRVAVMR